MRRLFSPLAGAAVLSMLVLAGAILVLDQTWHSAHKAAAATLEQTTRVVENIVNRQFLQTDVALAGLPTLFSAVLTHHSAVEPEAANRLLRGVNLQAYAFRDILLVDRDNKVWASVRPRPYSPALLRAIADGRGGNRDSLVVSGPIRNPQTGEWDLFLSRYVTVPGPGLLLAIAEMPLSTVTTILSEAGDGPGLHIALLRTDGVLLASVPHDELNMGKPLLFFGGEPRLNSSSSDITPGVQPEKRLFASRPTLYDDVTIALAMDSSAAMAAWENDRDRLLYFTAAAIIFIFAAAGVLQAARRRELQLERERTQAAARLESAIEGMSDGFVMWDKDDRLLTCNQKFRQLYAVSAPAIQPGIHFADVMRKGAEWGQYPDIDTDIETWVERMIAWHKQDHATMERLLPDGRWLLVNDRRMANGEIVGTRTDITRLKSALAELESANHRVHQQNRLFDAALNNMPHGLVMVDDQGAIIVSNRRFRELFNVTFKAAARGSRLQDFYQEVEGQDGWGAEAAETIKHMQLETSGTGRARNFRVTGKRNQITLSITQRPLDGGGFIAIYEDISEQQKAEDRIRYLAHHDALTGLANRAHFRNSVDDLLSFSQANDEKLALLYFDLDHFKEVNDTLGHPVGDLLLEAVGERLRSRLEGRGVVARLGGDEFAVAIRSPDVPQEAVQLGERLVEDVSRPYGLDGRQVTIGVSVGIAVASPSCSMTADTLLKNADIALYEAKESGRGTWKVFEPQLEARLFSRLKLEQDLQSALGKDELHVVYQPIQDLKSGRVRGFEALLRWQHPERGLISPAEFIPIAEEIELIGEIGAFVIDRACRDASELPNDIRIAINLSPVQLRHGDIIGTVASALMRSGLDPRRLELEITESAILDDDARVWEVLRSLREAGVRLVLDDFGTGYSSLSYLRKFPFDKIKIDRSFVREMISHPNSSAIVSTVVGLADRLGMTCTAEGVETEEQLAQVRAVGCTEVQGYLLGRPMPAAAAFENLAGTPEAHKLRA